jgi:hypothetical protein
MSNWDLDDDDFLVNTDNRSAREKIIDSFNYIPLSAMVGQYEQPKTKGKSFEELLGLSHCKNEK